MQIKIIRNPWRIQRPASKEEIINYFKQMYANPNVRFRGSTLTEKSAKFT